MEEELLIHDDHHHQHDDDHTRTTMIDHDPSSSSSLSSSTAIIHDRDRERIDDLHDNNRHHRSSRSPDSPYINDNNNNGQGSNNNGSDPLSSSSSSHYDSSSNNNDNNDLHLATADRGQLLRNDRARVYIGNIPQDTSDIRFQSVFNNYGKILSAFIVRNHRPATYGFIQFETADEAERTIAEMDGFEIEDGKKLEVKMARESRNNHALSNDIINSGTNGATPSNGPLEFDDKRLFVSNIGDGCSEDEIRSVFEVFGAIREVRLHNGLFSGYRRAHVEYLFPKDAAKAIVELNGKKVLRGRYQDEDPEKGESLQALLVVPARKIDSHNGSNRRGGFRERRDYRRDRENRSYSDRYRDASPTRIISPYNNAPPSPYGPPPPHPSSNHRSSYPPPPSTHRISPASNHHHSIPPPSHHHHHHGGGGGGNSRDPYYSYPPPSSLPPPPPTHYAYPPSNPYSSHPHPSHYSMPPNDHYAAGVGSMIDNPLTIIPSTNRHRSRSRSREGRRSRHHHHHHHSNNNNNNNNTTVPIHPSYTTPPPPHHLPHPSYHHHHTRSKSRERRSRSPRRK